MTTMMTCCTFKAILDALNARGGHRWHFTKLKGEPMFMRHVGDEVAPTITASDAFPYEGPLTDRFVVKVFDDEQVPVLSETTDVTFAGDEPADIADSIVATADRLLAYHASR